MTHTPPKCEDMPWLKVFAYPKWAYDSAIKNGFDSTTYGVTICRGGHVAEELAPDCLNGRFVLESEARELWVIRYRLAQAEDCLSRIAANECRISDADNLAEIARTFLENKR